MIFPILLAGAVVTPATPVEPTAWFTSREHPKTALMVVERGQIGYLIDISPDGTALRCETQGNSDLDRKVCDIVMKKARFFPAKDDAGRPMFGRHYGMASFLMPGKDKQRPDRAKLTVALDVLPDGIASPAYAKVAFLVDEAGVISRCASTAAERRGSFETVEALGALACNQLTYNYRPVPVRNTAGEAVPSIQSLIVRLEVRQTP